MQNTERRGVIDLGTNTFHLLIADVSGSDIREIYRERRYVKLASEGIHKIGAAPYQRGIAALQHFSQILKEHDCTDVLAFGTAALRTASNGPDFAAEATRATGIAITLIPGDEEARLITKGVLAAIPPLNDQILVMDIGGGSTEFIIADHGGVHFSQSFPIGVSVLKNEFHRSEPITWEETVTLQEHLRGVTQPLTDALKKYPATHLVGAAGTFDVLATVLTNPASPPHPTSHELELSGLTELRETITRSTLAERASIPGVPPERADMIVVAMILLDFVIQLAGIERITVSDYAMKEGILLDRAAE
ncbi:Ppx/GppA phosphatase family protein [Neolewinella antarctica]|uniref:Exopolyphosphatase/guanosine-5'-triphosphate, 3'-diphosphate pyrophosphatase n=1 Tax=Neolewinella antarctica TaxID=442734 RepID=A0ABX0X798_9BACT|nr:exopolyphosphatase [Neolewinella antarctica]NJC25110.1 exopolyphosphatase/guanosine-5'-triphosphate,3'-diphosphate pyrophosphatase [Neolewinella antarctica]